MVGVSATNPVRKTGQLLSRRARLVGRAYILADPCCVAFWLILGPGGEYSGKVECFRVAFLFGCVGGWSNSHVGLWLCCGFGVHVGLPKDGETSAGELGAEGESETPVRGRGPLLRSNCKKSNVALWLVGLVVARFCCAPR
jgi:hypothetical protein